MKLTGQRRNIEEEEWTSAQILCPVPYRGIDVPREMAEFQYATFALHSLVLPCDSFD